MGTGTVAPRRPLQVAVGPFEGDSRQEQRQSEWPLREAESLLAQGFGVQSCGPFADDADVLLHWSPEYHPLPDVGLPAGGAQTRLVAFLGDWHVRIPDLRAYDLIATDARGVAKLRALGYPDDRLLWWRGFSYDPALHCPPEDAAATRDIDVAFLGRPAPGRAAMGERLRAWAARTGKRVYWHTAPYPRGVEATVYRRARIVWNESQRGELNMRCYEAAACGALSVLQHDAVEVHRAGAPIPTYDPAHVEEFLDAWLRDDDARRRQVAAQAAWVAHERPADHLGWLLRRVRERLYGQEATHELAGGGGMDRGGAGNSGAAGVSVSGVAYPPDNEQRPEVCALVPHWAQRVLDLGCHQGGTGWRLKQECEGLHVSGVDVDPAAVERAHVREDAAYAFDLDSPPAAWRSQPWYVEGGYDCVLAADVLEHLRDPWTALALVRPLLSPGGVVVASIPQLRNVANLFDLVVNGRLDYFRHGIDDQGPDGHPATPADNVLSWGHLRLWTHASIETLFARSGFEVTRWERSTLAAPGLGRFVDDLAGVIESYGGDVDGWRRDAWTIQHLVVAKLGGATP